MDFTKLWQTMTSGTNLPFTVIMVLLFIFALSANGKKNLVNGMPVMLTSIGIFGTFFGIAMALLNFDYSNIHEQINIIISGMQTAFITSLLGIFLSVILKMILLIKDDNQPTDNTDAEALLQRFVQQSEDTGQILKQHQLAVQKMDELINIIGRDGMAEQIRLMRNDLSGIGKIHAKSFADRQNFENKLWQEMNKVTEKLSQSATKQIIDALRQVILDFNEKLTEQFGDNFKQLNQAVGALVQWQENYKGQIEQMTEQYTLGVQAIDDSKQAIQSIEQSTSTIPSHMTKLNEVIILNQTNMDELTKHLQAFADMRDKAIASLPEIQKHIGLVLTNMQEGSQQIEQVMTTTANTFASNSKESNNHIKKVADDISAWHKGFKDSLERLQKEFTDKLNSMANELKTNNEKIHKELKEISRKSWEETTEEITNILQDAHKTIAKEQTDALENMGKALLTITGQFTEDYSKLVKDMNDVVRKNGRQP